MDGNNTLCEVVDHVLDDIKTNGIDIISKRISGNFAWFRKLELAFALNRLRSFNVIQKDSNSG